MPPPPLPPPLGWPGRIWNWCRSYLGSDTLIIPITVFTFGFLDLIQWNFLNVTSTGIQQYQTLAGLSFMLHLSSWCWLSSLSQSGPSPKSGENWKVGTMKKWFFNFRLLLGLTSNIEDRGHIMNVVGSAWRKQQIYGHGVGVRSSNSFLSNRCRHLTSNLYQTAYPPEPRKTIMGTACTKIVDALHLHQFTLYCQCLKRLR